MDCQYGIRRRTAAWDEIEDAPQIKRTREDIKTNMQIEQKTQHINQNQPIQPTENTANITSTNDQPTNIVQTPAPVPPTPQFFISAPIQGYTIDHNGRCRYVFY